MLRGHLDEVSYSNVAGWAANPRIPIVLCQFRYSLMLGQ
jgi:hypothetical protein